MEAVRIAQFNVTGGRAGEALKQINDLLIPQMEAAPGFQKGYWLLDEASGDATAVTIWDSEEARAAFGQTMREAMQASGAISNTIIKDLPVVATASAVAGKPSGNA
ncbi:MAG TPA: hypothetical protein VGR61_10395 [Candidatus Dormibacteraeota bacterium]|nr:hypothetical protein [Candidatus Dormibacteraeota bacterium]